MLGQILLLVLGFVFMIKGADIFVDGASKIAVKCNIPEMVVGLTIVAMGTSAPEAAVSIKAALSPEGAGITVGNVLGSNIINILVILGVTALIAALPIKKNTMPAVVSNIMPREMVSEPECGMQSVQIKLIRDAYVKNLSAAFPLMMYSAHTMRKIRLQFPYCTKP